MRPFESSRDGSGDERGVHLLGHVVERLGGLRVAQRVDVGGVLRPDHHIDLLAEQRNGGLQVVVERGAGRMLGEESGIRVALHGGDAHRAGGHRSARPASPTSSEQRDGRRRVPRSAQARFTSSSSLQQQRAQPGEQEAEPGDADPGDQRPNGLSDCENASRPQEKPPYGHTLAIASRSVHSAGEHERAAAAAGRVRPGQTRGHPALGQASSASRRCAKKSDFEPGQGEPRESARGRR